MTGKMKWGPRLVRLASVQTKKDAEIHKIYDIARAPKCYELKTEIILGGIGDVFVEQAMTEHLVASISIQGVKIKLMKSNTRHYVITPEEVSHKFNIGIKKVKGTLRVTTQKWIKHEVYPLRRIYRVDKMQLNRKRPVCIFILIAFLAKTKYLEGNTGAWLFNTGNFKLTYPFTKRSEVGDTK